MKFSKKESDFFLKEFDVVVNEEETDHKVLAKLQDLAVDIEVYETIEADKTEESILSERGKMAENIVTRIGRGY